MIEEEVVVSEEDLEEEEQQEVDITEELNLSNKIASVLFNMLTLPLTLFKTHIVYCIANSDYLKKTIKNKVKYYIVFFLFMSGIVLITENLKYYIIFILSCIINEILLRRILNATR